MFALLVVLDVLFSAVWGTFILFAHMLDALTRWMLGDPQPDRRW